MKLLISILTLSLLITPGLAQEKADSAKVLFEQGSYAEAAATIGEPASPPEFYWLGRSQVQLKQLDEAEASFMQILAADEASSMAYDGLAHLANARKDYATALQHAAKAIELDANNAEAYQAQGVAYAYRGDVKNAQTSLEKSVQLNPGNGYGHYQLGMVYYRQKRFDQTINHFEKFIELMPNAPEATQVRSILKTVRG